MDVLIQAEGIRKRYAVRKGILEILRGASLNVARGESVAIIGMSGAFPRWNSLW